MDQTTSATGEKKKSPIKLIILAIVLLVGGFIAYSKISYAMDHEETDNAQVETLLLPVLPRISGYIKQINVRDFDSVKAGQLVAELDDAEWQTQLIQMQADVATAEADLSTAKSTLQNALVSLQVNKGAITLNQLRVTKALQDNNRDKNLLAAQAITQKQFDDSRFNLQSADQILQNSKTDLVAAESKISSLQAMVKRAESMLNSKKSLIDQQQLKLSYTKIFAPLTGKIGKKNVTEGQFVQSGAPLFTIVNDTTYWIIANFKESQIRRLHPGMGVEIELDAYPKLQIEGRIESLSEATGARFALIPPDNASGNFVKVTQRVPVRIKISNIQEYHNILKAGLSAKISIPLTQ
ncbi:MAG: HlyD family secretion protein [Chitinophagaceae bacterium]|nr:HlyD family secretion protein [Chitinophagaceae bacterium]